MESAEWLGLTDYASKYRISVSTLRRRIKNNQIAHRFQDGKYFVKDTAPEDGPISSSEALPLTQAAEERLSQLRSSAAQSKSSESDEEVLSSASRLLTELKRAYMNILQEKEEQIIQLKEEVSDLKTLVRVLEDDNERLRRMKGQAPPISS